ncbi:MAG: hypothetical protein E7277_06875 [Lachnospiraceae bacterium]|jgi:hypothetical protein|nr:hypothetical protein [Lachnospiraceae bacterium]
MKINKSTNYVGDELQVDKKSKGVSDKKTMDGSMLQPKFDPIEEKRNAAKKKALQILGNAYAKEQKINDEQNGRRERILNLKGDMDEANKEIQALEARRAELRELYGVPEDSAEEKELRLIEKASMANRPGSDIRLTKEEWEKVFLMKSTDLTEYQQYSLELFGFEGKFRGEMEEASREIQIETKVIQATELERLKTHPILDAKNQAEEVLENASKEIVGMLIDETKEHIDEEMEEEKEKAKEKEEKEEELQKKLEASKEKKKEMEKFVEDILDGVKQTSTVTKELDAAQQEVKDMMTKMKLIEEEIKGAAVDETV